MISFQSEKSGKLYWIRHVQLDSGSVLDHEILLGNSVARPWQEFYHSDSYERASGLPMLKLLKLDFSDRGVLEDYSFTCEVKTTICRELRKFNDLARRLKHLKTRLISVGSVLSNPG